MTHKKTASNKLRALPSAIHEFIHDGDCIAMEGFTHLIPFAAAHEIIRQRKKGLTACRLTPDLIYDQMIAAGCIQKLVFSWAGNPGVGSLHAFRRAVEKQVPHALELEEYSHFGMVMRLMAGAARLSFMPLRSYWGTELPRVNSRIRTIRCPYTGEEYFTVPALNPDVAILHAQRADLQGNTQAWGLLGVQKETAFAAQRVIVTVEEIVSSEQIRADSNRTLIPGFLVDAVVHVPFGAHPSYAQGYYDRDNQFYMEWDAISRDEERLQSYLKEFVYSPRDRSDYIELLGSARFQQLQTTLSLPPRAPV
jgi:glutaconate CoA-transferase, subunit A